MEIAVLCRDVATRNLVMLCIMGRVFYGDGQVEEMMKTLVS